MYMPSTEKVNTWKLYMAHCTMFNLYSWFTVSTVQFSAQCTSSMYCDKHNIKHWFKATHEIWIYDFIIVHVHLKTIQLHHTTVQYCLVELSRGMLVVHLYNWIENMYPYCSCVYIFLKNPHPPSYENHFLPQELCMLKENDFWVESIKRMKKLAFCT